MTRFIAFLANAALCFLSIFMIALAGVTLVMMIETVITGQLVVHS